VHLSIDYEASLLSFKNLELSVAILPVRAADRLPADWWFACRIWRMSIR